MSLHVFRYSSNLIVYSFFLAAHTAQDGHYWLWMDYLKQSYFCWLSSKIILIALIPWGVKCLIIIMMCIFHLDSSSYRWKYQKSEKKISAVWAISAVFLMWRNLPCTMLCCDLLSPLFVNLFLFSWVGGVIVFGLGGLIQVASVTVAPWGGYFHEDR